MRSRARSAKLRTLAPISQQNNNVEPVNSNVEAVVEAIVEAVMLDLSNVEAIEAILPTFAGKKVVSIFQF